MRKHHTSRSSERKRLRSIRHLAGFLVGGMAAGTVLLPGMASASPSNSTGAPVWAVNDRGAVTSPVGSATFGGLGHAPSSPVVATAATRDGKGYWMATADGQVFAFGDAALHGSAAGTTLAKPIVGITPTADGRGYWMVAADGGVFTFGDAAFHGSLSGAHIDTPVVALASTPDGGGYWVVTAGGGVYPFGDAVSHGSLAGKHLDQPIVGITPTPGGKGYWLVAADGGVFSFGDAPFHGSAAGSIPDDARGLVADAASGYWVIQDAGSPRQYGPAGTAPAVAVAVGAPAPVAAPVVTRGQAAVSFAERQIGKPYVWGGTGPNGYDCSGLAQASWGAAGVALQRVAADQYGDGAHYPLSQARPGDLVFWSSNGAPSGIYHVGLWVSPGQMVDAPDTGQDVQIQTIWGGVYPYVTRP